ncbi:MAG: T9SS type A sorting domain-containing protein [Candidatus Coatesbacteria bacterium]|nr:MAG: T9SS type A sorting domain-containing protein [Candidatus Coatesbacteria bacterium]
MRNTMLALAAAAFLACALSAAGAIVAKEDTVTYKIDRALSAGRLDPDEALMYRFFALNPVSMVHVPEEYRAEYYAPEPVSGTPVWLELVDRWPKMRPDVKRKIVEVFGGDPVNGGLRDGGTRYRPLPGFSSYSNYGGFQVYHYDSPGGNFRIHWVLEGPHRLQDPSDPNNNGVPEVIEYYADDAERAWTTFTTNDWFKHPDPHDQEYLPLKDYYPLIEWPPDEEWDYGGNDLWDIYLGAFSSNVLGMTTSDPFDFTETYRDDRVPYYMDRNIYEASGPNPERVTVAHELAHGVEYMFDAVESSASGTSRWYFEATSTWGQELVYPGDPGAIGRANTYLGNPLRSLKNPGDGGYMSVIINYFYNDWAERYWKPPQWKNHPRWMIREVWRALSKGDEWYTDDPTVNRESTEAMGYLATYYQNNPQYLDDRAFKDIFEYWTTWNWLTGARDDGQHYKYGSRFTTVVPQNTWGPSDYPIVNYEPGESYYMNFWGHGFYLFNQPPSWPGVSIYFEGDDDNPDASKDWGGQIYVTRNGSTWTSLEGTAGEASAMFTPEDKGIVLIRNPSQYQGIVAIFCCVADDGERLPFKYSFVRADDLTDPSVAGAVALSQSNPDYIRILVGSNEELFGKPEAEVWFTSSQTQERRGELLPMTASPSGRSFIGTFILDIGDKGSGTMKYRAADKAGNFVSGEKNFSAAYLASNGGSMGDANATLKLPVGTVAKPTLFLITPRTETSTAAPHAVASAIPDDEGAVETVGTVYDFAPSWARLAKPVAVTLSYEGLEVREDYLSVFQWNGTGWTDLGGSIDKRGHRVSATANSLGAFVLGYGEKKGNRPPAGTPKAFGLYQNYPNPAHEATVIKYALPEAADVELAVYDLSGRRVATVVHEPKNAGVYEVAYELTDDTGRALPSGVYLYRLTAGTEAATKKLVVGTR